jgi:hypothetical protein
MSVIIHNHDDVIYAVVVRRSAKDAPKLCKANDDKFYTDPLSAWKACRKVNTSLDMDAYSVVELDVNLCAEFRTVKDMSDPDYWDEDYWTPAELTEIEDA